MSASVVVEHRKRIHLQRGGEAKKDEAFGKPLPKPLRSARDLRGSAVTPFSCVLFIVGAHFEPIPCIFRLTRNSPV